MELFDVFTNVWLYVSLATIALIYILAHRDGFVAGVSAGIDKTLDVLVRVGLIYFDEREEMKRRNK